MNWAKRYQPERKELIESDKSYLARILSIGREGPKPRKDLIFAEQMAEFTAYFFEGTFQIEDAYPENTDGEDCSKILTEYLKTYNHSDSQEEWFEKIRQIGQKNGYAAKPKDYKKNPDQFKGHVGHVSTVIRIALTGRANSPDIWEIQQILGEDTVRRRMKTAILAL